MYTAQKNPAALRSQELICKAMCALMGTLPFGEITVTRICQEAAVVAGTAAVIRLWAERGFRETPEELVGLHRFALGEG